MMTTTCWMGVTGAETEVEMMPERQPAHPSMVEARVERVTERTMRDMTVYFREECLAGGGEYLSGNDELQHRGFSIVSPSLRQSAD